MDGKSVIRIKNLSKTFAIRENKIDSLRALAYSFFKPKEHIKVIKAVNDVSFEVKKGEFFGIIGKNGSGKSTLLKLILGSYKPDKGSKIEIDGKMMRLALGIGFDMNLSARDNIYLNGTIIGLSFKEIGEKFQDILAFAELEKFVDTPLKFYSSGMVSRLAFSLAVLSKANILLIDEFFGGVGDESFKEKSEKVFKNTVLDGRTIIFVSHDLGKIERYCDRAMFINEGEVLYIGDPAEAIKLYKEKVHSK